MSTASQVLQHLGSYELKGTGPEYTSNSPLRTNSDSHGFSVKIEDSEHGTYFDHVTGANGSLYELATVLGIETPKREKVEDSKRAYATLADYALLKGVPEQVFIDAGWELHTYFDGRHCFKFNTQGGERYRFTDGQKPSFKSIKGFEPCWYGLKRALTLTDKSPLIICNGEPSTIVAQHYGLPAFCMSGGENHKVSTELITDLKNAWKGSIKIALDCDEAGRAGTAKFVEAFSGVSIPYTVIDLMLSDKGDLADFCKLHGQTSIIDFGKLTPIGQKIPPKQIDVTDLVKVSRELLALRKNGSDNLEEALERLQVEINHLRPAKGEVVTFEQVSVDYEAWIKDNLLHPGEVQGFKSGSKKLDTLTGGLARHRMVVLLAETGMGKTTTVASIGSNLIDQAPGLIIPTESSALDWWNQLVAYRCGIPTHIMRQGRLTPQQVGLVYSTNALLKQLKCEVIECQNPTSSNIIQVAKAAIEKNGCQWIILDSLSNVKSDTHSSIFDTTSEAADCAQELARMGLMVLATSQVGRSLEGRDNRMPTLHDGKGSGRIEDNVGILLGLYNNAKLVQMGVKQPSVDFPAGIIAIACLKHRYEGDKEGMLVKLNFKGGQGVYD